MLHALRLTPACHGVDEGVNDLGVIDEVDVAEAGLFLSRTLVAHVVDDTGDTSHDFAVTISQIVNRLTEIEGRVLVGPEGVDFVGYQWGDEVLAVAVQRVDGEMDKLEQVALGGLDFSDFNHIILFFSSR